MTLVVDFQKAAIQQHPADYLCCFFTAKRRLCNPGKRDLDANHQGAGMPFVLSKETRQPTRKPRAVHRYGISWELFSDEALEVIFK